MKYKNRFAPGTDFFLGKGFYEFRDFSFDMEHRKLECQWQSRGESGHYDDRLPPQNKRQSADAANFTSLLEIMARPGFGIAIREISQQTILSHFRIFAVR